MAAEMAMRAIDGVEMGQDLTPPLAPLSHALHDSFLDSHCSACFSPLTSGATRHHLHVSYCCNACFTSDSPLHSSSAELHLLQSTSTNCELDEEDTADLRAALRILAAFPMAGAAGRVAGLLTNRDKLMNCRNSMNSDSYSEEIVWKIQNGGKVMAAARRARGNAEASEELKNTPLEEEEAALCAVLTNAVEVTDNHGRSLGIAVYGIDFSWINHSCSPNACYRFEFSSSNSDNLLSPCNSKMRISPKIQVVFKFEFLVLFEGLSVVHSTSAWFSSDQMNDGFGNNGIRKGKEQSEYGPRIILRSIRQIVNGMEVTIAYTDLLQPKAVRQLDLQSKYQFTCSCTRCSAEPLTYVDQALQDFCVVYDGMTGNISFDEDTINKLNDSIDDAISDYLSENDAESCCVKLENLLTLNMVELKSQNPILHPLHNLSMKAYIALASSYKTWASNLESSDMLRMSAAYSLLLAGATHHLFLSEPSLIVSAANFWKNAGESLLALSRSLQLSSTETQFPDSAKLSILQCRCSLLCENGYTNFGSKSRDFLQCSAYLSEQVCDFLAQGSRYLERINNFVNFNWIGTSSVSDTSIASRDLDSAYKSEVCNDRKKLYLYQLAIHCLEYGRFLSSICYGEDSYITGSSGQP